MKIIMMVLSLCIARFAYSGLATSSSRIIFDDSEIQRSLILANINEYPIIVQSWVDNGEGNPNYLNSPFVVTPPVFRMQPEQNNSIRIIFKGNSLPQDRESVYWLNLYEIPGKSKDISTNFELNQAYLNLAMNTQLKIFYRPKKLKKIGIEEIISQLNFSFEHLEGKTYLVCQNLSPYNVSFSKLKIVSANEEMLVEQMMDMMTKSLSYKRYLLSHDVEITQPIRIEFDVIDDDGKLKSSIFNFNK